MDRFKGVSVGNVIECENGYVVIPSYTEAIVFDKSGREIIRFDGKSKKQQDENASVKTPTGLVGDSGGHHGNWIKAIRSRKASDLTAEILEGHVSSGLVHTGNISFRMGAARSSEAIKETMQENKVLAEGFERMAAHLAANDVDISHEKVRLGIPLKFDPKKEQFVGNAEANRLLTRVYRAPFVVPKKV